MLIINTYAENNFSNSFLYLLMKIIIGTQESQNQNQNRKSDKPISVFTKLFRPSDEYSLKGDYEKAIQNDFSILRMAEALILLDEIGRAYNNIGINPLNIFKKGQESE